MEAELRRRARGKSELSPTTKRIALVAAPLPLLLLTVYITSITPGSIRIDPRYWASFTAWAVIARLWLPSKDAIPHRRKRKPGVLRTQWLALIALLAAALSYVYSPLLVFVAGFAGFPVGLSVAVYAIVVRYRLRPCKKCGRETWFIPDQGSLYCGVCGHRWSHASEAARS